MKKQIGVIGQGFVGGALTAGMSHVYNVHACDIAGIYSEHAKSGRESLYDLVQHLESLNKYMINLLLPEYILYVYLLR